MGFFSPYHSSSLFLFPSFVADVKNKNGLCVWRSPLWRDFFTSLFLPPPPLLLLLIFFHEKRVHLQILSSPVCMHGFFFYYCRREDGGCALFKKIWNASGSSSTTTTTDISFHVFIEGNERFGFRVTMVNFNLNLLLRVQYTRFWDVQRTILI